MSTRTIALTLGVLVAAAQLAAQPATAPAPGQPPRASTPAPTPAANVAVAPPSRRVGQPLNIRVEVTVTDQRGSGAPLKKVVTIVVADAMGGRIRSSAESAGGFTMPLNVDAEPEILNDGKIRLLLNLQYDLPTATGAEERALPTSVGSLRRTQLQENLSLILESGKAMVVAQSADPIGDRQVTIEVKATILR